MHISTSLVILGFAFVTTDSLAKKRFGDGKKKKKLLEIKSLEKAYLSPLHLGVKASHNPKQVSQIPQTKQNARCS
jgi:hypothetical protein